MPWGDWALALGLAVLTVATRWPYRARLLPTWDAVQFGLALGALRRRPAPAAPPGYILYVTLGRLLAPLLGDPAATLAGLAVGASALAVLLVYRLGVAARRPRRRHARRARPRGEPACSGRTAWSASPTPPRPRSRPASRSARGGCDGGRVRALVGSALLLGLAGRRAPVDAGDPRPALARDGVARVPAAGPGARRARSHRAGDGDLARADAVAHRGRAVRRPRASSSTSRPSTRRRSSAAAGRGTSSGSGRRSSSASGLFLPALAWGLRRAPAALRGGE